MKHLGDITKINGHEVPLVDIVTGGSPCQFPIAVTKIRFPEDHNSEKV